MSRVRGKARVNSLLRRIEPAMRDEIGTALQAAGRDLLRDMQAGIPVKTGAALRGLTMKCYPRTLRLRVGFLGRATNDRLFYARILEFGRGLKKSVDRLGRRIGIIRPGKFVFGPRTDLRRAIGEKIRGVWDRALDKASAGATGND